MTEHTLDHSTETMLGMVITEYGDTTHARNLIYMWTEIEHDVVDDFIKNNPEYKDLPKNKKEDLY